MPSHRREQWERQERQPVADFLAGEYWRPAPAALCPRCGTDQSSSYGAQRSCGRCGTVWQDDVPEAPMIPRERYQARRRLDEAQS
jgi:hypothetical protein